MRITAEQENILNRFTCERLSANPANRDKIQTFTSRRGLALVQYLKLKGWELDENGENAFYLIKNPQGEPCVFFALKCGALYTPLDEEEIKQQYERTQSFLELLKNTPIGDPDRDSLYAQLEQFRQEHNMTIDDAVHMAYDRATQEKNKRRDILTRLKTDIDREGSRPIQRVRNTYPGVELTHFCTNDLTRADWDQYGFRFPMGEVLFWKFIAPIFDKLQELVGCQHAFLFAADSTPDGTLTNYYNVSLKFSKYDNVGTSKPYYDWCCEFMSQEVRALHNNRISFFENFNIDDATDVI